MLNTNDSVFNIEDFLLTVWGEGVQKKTKVIITFVFYFSVYRICIMRSGL